MDAGLSAEALRQIPQPRQLTFPTRSADFFLQVNLTITGNISSTGSMGVLWTPQTSRRFRLRGGELSATFTTAGTGSGIDHLCLFNDGATLASDVVWSLGAFDRASPAGYVICDRTQIYLAEGARGKSLDTVLRVGSNATIGSGVIRVSGVLWGTEMTR